MFLELIAPFAEASYDIINSILEGGVKQSNIGLLDKGTNINGVAVKVAFKDEEHSAVIIAMEEPVAKSLSEQYMQEPFTGWNPLSVSALCEFGNLVSGAAVTKLDEKGFSLDITPPEIIFRDRIDQELRVKREAINVMIDTVVGCIQVIVYINPDGF